MGLPSAYPHYNSNPQISVRCPIIQSSDDSSYPETASDSKGWGLTPRGIASPSEAKHKIRLSCDTHHSFLSSQNSIHLLCKVIFLFVVVQSLRHVQLFVTPWATARQDSLSITNSQSPPKPMSTESVMPSNHLILCHPLLLLPSIFPSIRVFSNESALRIRWPKDWRFSFTIPQLIVLLSLRICFQTNCWKAIPWIKHKVPQE